MPRWISLGGEVRGRAESWFGSEKLPGATEWDYLNRIRFDTTIRASRNIQFFVQLQDSRAVHPSELKLPATIVNPLDLRQAWVHIGSGDEKKGAWIRVGRQPLSFGAARLLWMSEWGNVGPGFDGVRLGYGRSSFTVNLFSAAAVRNVFGEIDTLHTDRQMHGFFGSFRKLIPNATVEPFLLWKHNHVVLCEHGTRGHMDLATWGFRAGGKLPHRFDYISDIALQNGHQSADRVRAWATHQEIGLKPWKSESAPRLAFEYQRASGDKTPGDGVHTSFDQLYPAWKFGTADPIGWSNMQEVAGSVEWTCPLRMQCRASYHHFWILSRNDSLYAANGSVLGRNPNATSDNIGNEVDVRVTRKFGSKLSLMAGLGEFLPGEYWRQTKNTGPITYPFVMWNYTIH
ncbi:MAG: alginate export family protein [Bryobacteraceae bacterium]|nr:alginate export family protein [Bryobacteraceae bacterium]